MKPSILIVDDNISIQRLLVDFLSAEGFVTSWASNGLEALQKIKIETPDLILIDIMMPIMSGYELITKLREKSGTPIIIISAKRDESDVVSGFELGADDFIHKPFRMMELLSRIKAVLKRTQLDSFASDQLIAGPLTIDMNKKQLYCQGSPVALTKAEYTLLVQLMKSKGDAVSKEKISCQLIESGFSGSDSTLKIHIRNLRKKLALYSDGAIKIESLFGVGYQVKVVR